MSLFPLIAFGIILAVSLIIGFFIFLKPHLAIEIQKRFYARINWRIEPVSLTKEIRNTSIMGLFIIIATFFSAVYILIRFK